MRKAFLIITLALLTISFPIDSNSEQPEFSCPEKCIESRKNCELSCSQIVGGGAKSRERRLCVNECGVGLDECNERCINPTPKPTLIPERYHDKPCTKGCELKAYDCREVCTKYTGGGAKSGKRAVCNKECKEGLEDCKKWCVNPTPKPTIPPSFFDDKSCTEVCRYKKLDCEADCSVYIGGGAKSEKRSECTLDCRDVNTKCIDECKE